MEWKCYISVSPVCVVYHSKWSLSMLSVSLTHFCIGRGVPWLSDPWASAGGLEDVDEPFGVASWRRTSTGSRRSFEEVDVAPLASTWSKRDVFSPNIYAHLMFYGHLITFGPVLSHSGPRRECIFYWFKTFQNKMVLLSIFSWRCKALDW